MSMWSVFDNAAADAISGVTLAIGATGVAIARRHWTKIRKRLDQRTNLHVKQTEIVGRLDKLHAKRQLEIEEKLNAIARTSIPSLNLIGGLYLDIMLRPIGTEVLSGQEWSNLDPVDLQLGGSCYWVGRYLSEIYQESSYLHSLVGSGNDALTQEALRLIAQEKWILNSLPRGSRSTQAAVSVHLIQRSNEYTTIFTHRGALAEFTWQDVQFNVDASTNIPSIIHISGFMKTNLVSGLIRFLRVAHSRDVIVFDHGGLVSHAENPNSINAIREAFEQGLIDIYTCNYPDFVRFCTFPDTGSFNLDSNNIKDHLIALAAMHPLPCFTIVRGEDLPDRTKAYVIAGGHVVEVSLQGADTIPNGFFFSKLMFDAGFLHSLSHNDSNTTLAARILSAASEGLDAWGKRANIGLL